MTALSHELRYALRALGRMRGTSLLAVATLALGIAAAATTFSAVYAALFRAVPFPDADRLLYIQTTRQTVRDGTVFLRWSPAAADALRRRAVSFEAMATYTRTSIALRVTGESEQIDGEIVSPGYFDVVSVAPAIGRPFTPEEDAGHAVAIIGDGLWKGRFAADPAIVGRTLLVNGVPLTIVGVMPPRFDGISGEAALWFPRGMAPRLTYREYLTTPQHFMNLVGRLKPGVSLAQANAELASLGPTLPNVTEPDAPPTSWSAAATPIGKARVDAVQRRSLMLLFAGGVCVLLVTCANVAMLLLARARSRRGEMAIRLALGASRGRLVRHLLTESAILAAGGAALGVILASWAVAWLRTASPAVLPSPQNNYGQIAGFAAPSIDTVVLLFVAAIATAATLAFGAAPALSASRSDPAGALADSSRGLAGGGRGRALSALVVSQIAVAVLLLSGSILLATTVANLQAASGAFDAGALTFWINAPASRYADEQGPQVVERMLERIRRVPGVTDASVNRCAPYGASCARTLLYLPGRPFADQQNAPVVGRHYVSSSYFRTLGIPLRRGRAITDDDREGRPLVTVINETAARRFWPNEDPIGKHVWFGFAFTDPARPVEVVGVVADVKYWPPNEPIGPDFYTSYLQFTYPSSMYIVKAPDPAAVVQTIRRAIAEVDPATAMYDVELVKARVAEAVARPRFTAAVTGMFAVTAAGLAALGVFGVMAYSVATRRQELALRLALGATPRALRRRIVAQAARLAALGAGVGLVTGYWLLRALGGFVYGISTTDPVVLGMAVASMAAAALLAAVVPAWRASATDPMLLLRR